MLFIPSNEIKEIALKVGFQDVGIAKACELENEQEALNTWLKRKYHASMKFMENYFEKRVNPLLLVNNSRSIISILLSYKPVEELSGDLRVAKYAYGKDYHFIIKEKLYKMITLIQEKYSDFSAIPFVDSAPVMEKAWAAKSGLGWIGKNTCLISPKWGSFCFIGELICNAVTDYDIPIENQCGNCSQCIDVCPNNALEKEYLLNCNKCISYHTIENRESKIPSHIQPNNYVFGCDCCQNCCPYNQNYSKNTHDFSFKSISNLAIYLSSNQIKNIQKQEFKKIAKHSALSRISYEQFIRNVNHCLVNENINI